LKEPKIERMVKVEPARIAQEQTVQERDIQRTSVVEKTRIQQEQEVEVRNIGRNIVVQKAEVDKEYELEKNKIEKKHLLHIVEIENKEILDGYFEVCVFKLMNADAEEVAQLLEGFLSPYSKISVYKTGNAIVVKDSKSGIKNAREIITALDACNQYRPVALSEE